MDGNCDESWVRCASGDALVDESFECFAFVLEPTDLDPTRPDILPARRSPDILPQRMLYFTLI